MKNTDDEYIIIFNQYFVFRLLLKEMGNENNVVFFDHIVLGS